MGLRPIQVDEEHVWGRTWRTHSCVPCSHSCEHKLDRTKASVPMSGDAALDECVRHSSSTERNEYHCLSTL
jgi:hypothetical protein